MSFIWHYIELVIAGRVNGDIGLFITLVMYRMGNFLYYHFGCTSIYRPLSHPYIAGIVSIHMYRSHFGLTD